MIHRPAVPTLSPSRSAAGKRAKGQPGQSDAKIRLRATHFQQGRADRGLCSFARSANAQPDRDGDDG